MRESGVVRKVVNGKAHVLVKRQLPSCCSGCNLCTVKDARTAEIVLDAVPGLQARDEVVIEIPTPSPLRASVLLFLAPMLLLVGVTIAGHLLLAGGEGTSAVSLPAVGLGILAAALWYALIYHLDRRSRNHGEGAPRIVQHHHPADAPVEHGEYGELIRK